MTDQETRQGVPGPQEMVPPEDDSEDLYEASKRKRRRQVLGGVVAALVLGGLGYWTYLHFFRLDSLIKEAKECPSPVGAECKGIMKELGGYLPHSCPRLLAAIKSEPSLDKKNNLLHALLLWRYAQSPKRELTRASVAGQSCIQEAVLHVHHAAKKPPDTYIRFAIVGLSDANTDLFTRPAAWGIRVRILARMKLPWLQRMFEELAGSLDLLKGIPKAALRQAAKKVARKHLLPVLTKLYRAGLRNPGRTAKGMPKLIGPFPATLDHWIAFLAPAGSPLNREIQDAFFSRLLYGDEGSRALSRWHLQLFKLPHADGKTQIPAVLHRAEKGRHECLSCFYRLVAQLGSPKHITPSRIHGWLVEGVNLVQQEAYGGCSEILRRSLEHFPNGPLLLRLLHLDNLIIQDPMLKPLRALLRVDKGAADEVARSYQAAVLAYQGRVSLQYGPGLRPLTRYDWMDWLNRFFGIRLGEPGIPSQNPPVGGWQRWGEKHTSSAIRAAFARAPKAIGANLRSSDANVRFLAPLALVQRPFAQRLALLRPGLSDKLPSVRAMTAYALGLGVNQKADVAQLAPLLQKLRQDPDWTVRLVAFKGLAALKQLALLEPFVSDPAPLTVRSWEQMAMTWPRSKQLAWLDRKDRGAGLVLRGIRARSPSDGSAIPRSTWDRLNALVKRSSSWLRLRLLVHFGDIAKQRIDWTPLYTDRSLVVRYRAVTALVRRFGPKDHPYASPTFGLLKDKNLRVVAQAAQGLGLLKHRPALPALQRLVTHRACFVRRAALSAVGSITGKAVETTDCQQNIYCY